ncbi:MAG: glycosyltransferase family 4 protein [Ruminococcaceae bacterium]|nr:glycosyltransferase family 4 protein [Oscillospiraceae bacterium]
MKILMVNKFLHPNGGSETYIFKLGEQLTKLGHEVQYFGMEHEGRCVGNAAEQYTEDMDFHGGSKLKKLTYPVKTIYSSEAKRKITAVLDDFKPDIIHINNFNYQLTPSILYAAQNYKKRAGKKVKIIYTAHDGQLICPNHLMFDKDGQVCEKCAGGRFINCTKKSCIHGSKVKSIIGTCEATLYKTLGTYKYFDKIICCSEFLKSKMGQNPVLAGKTVAMHNFIEKQPGADVEKENYVLYFGRYSKEKGVELMPKAKNIRFICAGSGDLEDLLDEAENVENVGFKSGKELEMLIRKAACSVCPSTCYDNCPFSVMESIMYGTPVVGANIGGIPELVKDGKTGVLFNSGDAEDFERAILTAVQNADELSKNCLETSFDDAETYCEKLIKIYTE